jgi:hypothetical protein
MAYRIANAPTGSSVISFEVFTASTGGTVTVPAHLYVGSLPTAFPTASTTITVGPTPGWYEAVFAGPVPTSGIFFISIDSSAQTVYDSDLVTGSVNLGYSRLPGSPSWSLQILSPAWRVTCAPVFAVPQLTNNGLPQLGSTYGLELSDALPSTFALLASGVSDTAWSGGALPAALPGAPGCDLLVSPEVLAAVVTSPTGAASASIGVPNSAGLVGVVLFHQWAVLDGAANTLGIVTTNAGRATVGN